jgi:ribosomal protein S2
VKAVLDSNKDKPNSERVIPINDEELSSIIQSLAKKANINLGDLPYTRLHECDSRLTRRTMNKTICLIMLC